MTRLQLRILIKAYQNLSEINQGNNDQLADKFLEMSEDLIEKHERLFPYTQLILDYEPQVIPDDIYNEEIDDYDNEIVWPDGNLYFNNPNYIEDNNLDN